MPPFLETLSLIGTVAMLWVGGGILVHGLAAFGVTAPEHVIHDVAEAVRAAVPVAGDVLAWLVSATGAAIVGLVAGALTAAVVASLERRSARPRRGTERASWRRRRVLLLRVGDGGGVALGRALRLAGETGASVHSAPNSRGIVLR